MALTHEERELVAVGAAFAVDCTWSLEEHLRASEILGIAGEEIQEVVQMAGFIRKMAASHVEKLADVAEAAEAAPEKEARAAGCCC
jgi:alkylhydroperoxidase/carboxymuconolactone decarboxylase family protein YurZ